MISLMFSLMVWSPSVLRVTRSCAASAATVCHPADRVLGSALALDVEVEHVTLDVVVHGDRQPRRRRCARAALAVDDLEVPLDVVGLGLLDVVAHGSPRCLCGLSVRREKGRVA